VTACTICHAPAGDDVPGACTACQYRLDYVLQQLAAQEPLLRAQLAPYRSPSTGTRFGGTAHPPLPVDVRVLDLLATHWEPDPAGQDTSGIPAIPIGPLLVGWCHRLADSYPAVSRHGGTAYITAGCDPLPRTAGGIPGWTAWLRAYTPYAATWDRAPELWAAMEDALHRVRAITGTQPRTRPRWAPCPACSAFALSRTDGDYHVHCQACSHRLTPEEYAAHAAQTLPGLTAMAVRIATTPRDDAHDDAGDAPHDAHDAA
jgi:hypothetical protein